MAVAYGLHVANLVFHETFPDIWKLYQLIPVEAGPEFGNFQNHSRLTIDINTNWSQIRIGLAVVAHYFRYKTMTKKIEELEKIM